ncbi:hypothetical protein HYV57_01605 [Candidatus Peregrinibacteria bacterium]|nr:hypothetical protein [Candidatus Peregrinibacteria bacterium]
MENKKNTHWLMGIGFLAIIIAIVVMARYQENNLKASISQITTSKPAAETTSAKKGVIKTLKKKIFDDKIEATFTKYDLGYSMDIDKKQFAANPISKEAADEIAAKMQTTTQTWDKPQKVLMLNAQSGQILQGDFYTLLAAQDKGRSFRVVLGRSYNSSYYSFTEGKDFKCESSRSYTSVDPIIPTKTHVYYECSSPVVAMNGSSETYENLSISGDLPSSILNVWGASYIKPYTVDYSYISEYKYYSGDYATLSFYAE